MKRNIYQNKQGKSKGIAKETTVLLVKNLTAYITKLAESESEELDLTSGELPLCLDADAGGGRFLAIFTFLIGKMASETAPLSCFQSFRLPQKS